MGVGRNKATIALLEPELGISLATIQTTTTTTRLADVLYEQRQNSDGNVIQDMPKLTGYWLSDTGIG